MLGLEPRECFRLIAEPQWVGIRHRVVDRCRVAIGVQLVVSLVGGVQVEVDDPPECCVQRCLSQVLVCCHGRVSGLNPVQVDEQLPVRISLDVLVRPVQDQPRLADSTRAGHGIERGARVFEFVSSSGERSRSGGQLPRDDC
ncbi:hypothetical protein [Kibdelosporangium phytohabitans]|uniref:hypothetical protein n=1 Tax=Kibdelosporangium phytohabitans TaxID=860235 RepID=UPI0019DB584E|nr:hypothetical protein [Kibdelosporangium phytohabitans]